jgi:hypothetical protein
VLEERNRDSNRMRKREGNEEREQERDGRVEIVKYSLQQPIRYLLFNVRC